MARLTKEQKLKLVEDLKNGVSITEICKKYTVSMQTVYKMRKALQDSGELNKVEKQNNDQKEETTTQSSTTTINRYKRREVVRAGLIKDRHDMPVDEYVVNFVPDGFDYRYIDSRVSEYILNRIGLTVDENGKQRGAKDLIVYCTGLTCVVGSLIKFCSMYNVNLTLMHYKAEEGTYKEQVIFIDTDDIVYQIFDFGDIESNLVLEDITREELSTLETNDELLMVKTISKVSERSKISSLDIHIFKDYAKAYEYYIKSLINLTNTNNYISIYFDKGKISKFNKYVRIKTVLRTHNFEPLKRNEEDNK